MKFSCERCGQKYAAAELSGSRRVHRVPCKACGHLIVVKAELSEPTTEPRTPAPPAPAELQASDGGVTRPREVAGTLSPMRAHTAAFEEAVGSRPPLAEYVDLFGDPLSDPPPAEASAPAPAAADPFAPVREAQPPAAEQIPLFPATDPAFRLPAMARPPPPGRTPFVLLGAGGLVLVGILAYVLLGGVEAAPPGRERDARAGTPSSPAAASQAPAAPAQPGGPASAPGARPARRASDDRHARVAERPRERDAKSARERSPSARERSPQEAEGERGVATPPRQAKGGLAQDEIQQVLASARRGFDHCIATTDDTGEVPLDGRRAVLRLFVLNDGAVTSPMLDDAALDGSELGECLKGAARAMTFPRSSGQMVRVEVPLVLARAR